jgi:heme/copper-type cytochrome/quinol oxidase subunit 2
MLCTDGQVENSRNTECVAAAKKPIWREVWFWSAMGFVIAVSVINGSFYVVVSGMRRHKNAAEPEPEADKAAHWEVQQKGKRLVL